MKHGMCEGYTLWHFHGETPLVNQVSHVSQPGTSINIVEDIHKSNFPPLDDLMNDACGIFTRESSPSTLNSERSGEAYANSDVPNDPQTHKGKKYQHLHRLAMEPLHPATCASRHTTMFALLKLNDLKTQFNLSDGTTGGILGLLKELLPEWNNLTASYAEMKNTIKDIGMDYIKYDACINNCMLFWKEHEHINEGARAH